MDKSVQITAIIVTGIILLGLIGFMTFSNLGNPYSDTLNVNGNGEVDAMPDLVSVYFNIETKGSTSKEASDKNTEIYNSLKSGLISAGFTEEEIQTQNYNVYPNYIYTNGNRNQDGYVTTHSIVLEFSIEEKEKIGGVIDVGVSSGAGISYVAFELSKELESQYKTQAIKQASNDAKTKAEALASGLNKNLGRLVSVSLDDYYYIPFRAYDSATTSGEASATQIEESVNINPSTQKVTARVTAVYRIK